jgi:sugar (pentulose or hexulose) kinase
MPKSVTAVFDIGKTNKKFFLFDEDLNEVYHDYLKLPLVADDDGFECDDLPALTRWIKKTVSDLSTSSEFSLEALNFSTYGATVVHLDEKGEPVTSLYNYLKPFPDDLARDFAKKYGREKNDRETASPFLGMLNSGLQLYWLKYNKPNLFAKVRSTLHFPQYLSYVFTRKQVSEPTSIGCHTKLWDFEKKNYHSWVMDENMLGLFPQIVPTTHAYEVILNNRKIKVGVGIHDSSSALTSYFNRTDKPFILVSTGTWSVTLNALTTDHLTDDDLSKDCLNFLSITGKPVRASRLFLGNELDHQLAIMNRIFSMDPFYYKQVKLNPVFLQEIESQSIDCQFYPETIQNPRLVDQVLTPRRWEPSLFSTFDEAYHHLIWGLVQLQVESIRLAVGTSGIRNIFVDGGFIDNDLYIQLLRFYLPDFQIDVSHQPLGSAYGAALVLNPAKIQMLATP